MAVITKVLPGRISFPIPGKNGRSRGRTAEGGCFHKNLQLLPECHKTPALAASALAAYDAPFAFL